MHYRYSVDSFIRASLLLILFIFYNAALAQWTEPVQISPFELGILDGRISSGGNSLHVVGTGLGTADLYYIRSTDNGQTWSEPICPVDTFQLSEMPDILCSNGYVHIIGILVPRGQQRKMFHFSSSDGGVSWSPPHLITGEYSLSLKYPRLAVSGDTVCAEITTSPYLFVSVSYDNGLTWSGLQQVDYGASHAIDNFPALYYSNGRLHLFYQLNVPDDTVGLEIYYRSSDDLGATWSDRYPLSTPENWQERKYGQAPPAYVDSLGRIICLWFDNKYGSACGVPTGDILGRVSLDNGDSWLPETRVTYTQTGMGSSCLILADKLQAVWMDYNYYYCHRPKIMYSASTDWGASWTEPELISGEVERSDFAPDIDYNVSSGDTLLHCVFDGRYPSVNSALFYNRKQEIVSIKGEEDAHKPGPLSLRAYPNPFNSFIAIYYTEQEGGDIAIDIFNLNGQKVRSYKNLKPKEGKITWDATDAAGEKVSSGIYFVRANGPVGSQTIKLMHLK